MRGGRRLLLPLAGLGALVVFPHVFNPYFTSVLLQIFMFTALATSWNIISGYVGYISFGHVAFFGVGAYVGALLIKDLAVHWLPAALAGGLGSLLISALIGYPCLRLRGPYFAIAMLGLAELMAVIVSMLEPITRGGLGIDLPPVRDIVSVYYAMGATALVVVLVTYWINSTRFGLQLLAIREDEVAAGALGINTTLRKLQAFMLSAIFPGVVGGIYAWYVSYIDPSTVFSILLTLQMVVMTMFGGRGTVQGPVLGAFILYLISEVTWAQFPFLHQAIFGALMVLIVVFAPRGIMGFLHERGLVAYRHFG
ncbi:MAG: branched-chain amino acid ABC transporter permease [Nitrospinota bacterium]